MKSFKFGQKVYLPLCDRGLNFELVRGTIEGVRKYKTSTSNYAYSVSTPRGNFEVLDCDIYESVDDFITDIKNCVVE